MGIELTTLSNRITVSNGGDNITLSIPALATTWGGIGGTLSDQTDLKNQQDAQDVAIALKLSLAGGAITGNLDIGGDLTVTGSIQGFESGSFKIISSFDDIADFKTGSVYNLPEAAYFWAAALNFGSDTINLNDANGIYMFYGANFKQLTYTGITPFISTDKTGVSIDFIRIFLSTPNATCLKLQNGNSCILEFPVFIGCKTCVDLDTMAFCTADKLAMVGCERGLILKDVQTMSVQVGQWSGGQDNSGIAFDLSGAASERFFMTSSDSRPEATECFINVQASYGGLVDLAAGVHTPGGGDFFSSAGRNQNDKDISVTAIQFVTSSKSTAALHVAPGDEAATTVVLNTQVLIAGAFTEDVAQRFMTNAAGRATYIGNETRIFDFIVKFQGTPTTGNNKNYDFYMRVNGSVLVDISFDTINADAGTPQKAILIGEVELSTNDYIELIVIGRATAPTNITCEGIAIVITT